MDRTNAVRRRRDLKTEHGLGATGKTVPAGVRAATALGKAFDEEKQRRKEFQIETEGPGGAAGEGKRGKAQLLLPDPTCGPTTSRPVRSKLPLMLPGSPISR